MLVWGRLEGSSDWSSRSSVSSVIKPKRPKRIGGENVTTHSTSFVGRLKPSSIQVYNLWTTMANSCYASRVLGIQ